MSLDARMSQLLAEMSVLSEVSAAKLGDVVHGGERSRAPRGPNDSTEALFRARYEAAGSDLERARVVVRAAEALRSARLSRSPRWGLVPETQEWRKRIGTWEGSIADVVHEFGVTPATVYRCRAKYGKRAA